MESITVLFNDEETKAFLATYITGLVQGANPIGLSPQTEEEAQKTEENVKTLTKEVAMAFLEEGLPIGVTSVLDRKVEGWRNTLESDPHALMKLAGFLNQVGIKDKAEGWLQDQIDNIAGSIGSRPTSSTSKGTRSGVR